MLGDFSFDCSKKISIILGESVVLRNKILFAAYNGQKELHKQIERWKLKWLTIKLMQMKFSTTANLRKLQAAIVGKLKGMQTLFAPLVASLIGASTKIKLTMRSTISDSASALNCTTARLQTNTSSTTEGLLVKNFGTTFIITTDGLGEFLPKIFTSSELRRAYFFASGVATWTKNFSDRLTFRFFFYNI